MELLILGSLLDEMLLRTSYTCRCWYAFVFLYSDCSCTSRQPPMVEVPLECQLVDTGMLFPSCSWIAAAQAGSLLVEVPLERQMLEVMLEAGPAGILSVTVFERLHLPAKKYLPLLSEVVKKYGLQVRAFSK